MNNESENTIKYLAEQMYGNIVHSTDFSTDQIQNIQRAMFFLEKSELLPKGSYNTIREQFDNHFFRHVTPLDDLPNLSSYVNRLKSYNIYSLQDCTFITQQEFLQLKYIGLNALTLVLPHLEDYGLSFLTEERRINSGLGIFPLEMIIELNRFNIQSIDQITIPLLLQVQKSNSTEPLAQTHLLKNLLIGIKSTLIDTDIIIRWHEEIKSLDLFKLCNQEIDIDIDEYFLTFLSICNQLDITVPEIIEGNIPYGKIQLHYQNDYGIFKYILAIYGLKKGS